MKKRLILSVVMLTTFSSVHFCLRGAQNEQLQLASENAHEMILRSRVWSHYYNKTLHRFWHTWSPAQKQQILDHLRRLGVFSAVDWNMDRVPFIGIGGRGG